MEEIVLFVGRRPRLHTPSTPICSNANHMPMATNSLHQITQADNGPQMSELSSDSAPEYVDRPSSPKRDYSPKIDLIAASIKQVVDASSVQTFENFQNYHNKLHVYPADDAISAKDEHGDWIGYGKYTFDMYGQETEDLRVCLVQDTVWVERAEVWVALEAFLSGVSPTANIWEEPKESLSTEDKNKLCQDQWTWWQKTGKKFRLLNLPTEVREIIYDFSVVDTIRPYPANHRRNLSGLHTKALAARLPNMALLKANKQVYTEGIHLLYRESVFLVEHPSILKKLLAKESCRDSITTLSLHMTSRGFSRLFGCSVKDHLGQYKEWRPRRAARLLRGMNLKELILSVPFPELPMRSTFIAAGSQYHTCHKVMVDWILEGAWPWVKGLPVVVQGGVKTGQKEKFLRRCAEERGRYLEWCKNPLREPEEKTLECYYGDSDSGVRVDGEGSPIDGPDHAKRVPHSCKCTLPCSEQWTPED